MALLKALLTACTVLERGAGGGTLHLHRWRLTDRVHEILWVSPSGATYRLPDDPDVVKTFFVEGTDWIAATAWLRARGVEPLD